MPGPAEINNNNQAQITMSDLLVESVREKDINPVTELATLRSIRKG